MTNVKTTIMTQLKLYNILFPSHNLFRELYRQQRLQVAQRIFILNAAEHAAKQIVCVSTKGTGGYIRRIVIFWLRGAHNCCMCCMEFTVTLLILIFKGVRNAK